MESQHWLARLNRNEARDRIQESVVIVPTAATEQHGPHLPIDTDSCIVEALVERVCDRASVPVVATPVVVFGASHHHFSFPGVLSLRSTTFSAVVRDILDSLSRSGARRVYLLNGHGGNDETIRLAAREESRALGLAIGAASYWSLAWEAMLALDAHNQIGPLPGHAGGFETSMMLALRPDSVRTDLLAQTRPPTPGSPWPSGAQGLIEQPNGVLEQGNGMSDDALTASAEWGTRMLDAITSSVAESLNAFHAATVSATKRE